MWSSPKVFHVGMYAILLFFTVCFLLPPLLIVTNSFMSSFELANRYSRDFTPANSFSGMGVYTVHFVQFSLVPSVVSVKQYVSLFFVTPFYLGLFLNSVKLTVPIVLGLILVSAPAAYVFEVAEFRFKEVLFFIYIVIMLLPLQVTIVPNFIIAQFIHTNGTYLAIILPAIFNPFGVFLIRQFLKGIPHEYIEAARIDGAGHGRAFLWVILPLAKGAVASLAILMFVEYWNVVDQAIVFIQDITAEPLSSYMSHMSGDMTVIFALSVFYMLPVVLVFLFGQEYMVEGIQLSGIK